MNECVGSACAIHDPDRGIIQAVVFDGTLDDTGVNLGVDETGRTQYRNVAQEVPLAACRLAVYCRRNSAELITD